MASRFELNLAHELDASWILALFLAIHGGDPPPQEQTARLGEETVALVAALTEHLTEAGIARHAAPLTLAMLQTRLKPFGIEILPEGAEDTRRAAPEEPPRQPPPWCFVFRGQTICIERPRLTHMIE